MSNSRGLPIFRRTYVLYQSVYNALTSPSLLYINYYIIQSADLARIATLADRPLSKRNIAAATLTERPDQFLDPPVYTNCKTADLLSVRVQIGHSHDLEEAMLV